MSIVELGPTEDRTPPLQVPGSSPLRVKKGLPEMFCMLICQTRLEKVDFSCQISRQELILDPSSLEYPQNR